MILLVAFVLLLLLLAVWYRESITQLWIEFDQLFKQLFCGLKTGELIHHLKSNGATGTFPIYKIVRKLFCVTEASKAKEILKDTHTYSRSEANFIFGSYMNIHNIFTSQDYNYIQNALAVWRKLLKPEKLSNDFFNSFFESFKATWIDVVKTSSDKTVNIQPLIEATVLKAFTLAFLDVDIPFDTAQMVATLIKRLWKRKSEAETFYLASCMPTHCWDVYQTRKQLVKIMEQQSADNYDQLKSNENYRELMAVVPEEKSVDVLNRYLNLCSVLIPGYETTARVIVSLIGEIVKLPLQLKLLQAEADQFAITNDLDVLQLIKSAFLEALRLHPPSPIVYRKTVGPNQEFPLNSTIAVSLESLNRNPTVWQDPSDFQPERFLNHNDLERKLASFSLGPSKCLGNKLAIMMGSVSSAIILATTDLQVLQTKGSGRSAKLVVNLRLR